MARFPVGEFDKTRSLVRARIAEWELPHGAILVQQGVDLDWTSSDFMSDGYTLLHEAAWRGSARSQHICMV